MTFGHRPARDFPYFDAPPIGLAHRGGALHPDNRGRENTLEAFATAVGLGLRYVETDVHATRDGVVVAFHDACLDRVTDGSGSIADRTWARSPRFGSTAGMPCRAWTSACSPFRTRASTSTSRHRAPSPRCGG